MSLMGLDIGISGCKAVAFGPAGELLADAYAEYRLYQPKPGWMEFDPEEVWDAVSGVMRSVASRVPSDPVRALAVSTHGESVVPIDATGRPIYRFLTAIDTRATAEAQWWDEVLGRDRVFQITGMPLHPMYTVNKLMWLRRNAPEVFGAANRFLCMPDFVFHRLGVPPAMDFSLAARTMAFDVSRLDWSREILDLAGIDGQKLSPAVRAGTALGEVPSAVCDDLGLARGAIAVTGGHDHPCGAVGSGAVGEGIVMDSTGTVECVTLSTERLVLDRKLAEANLPVAASTMPGMYLVMGYSTAGGALLRWYRDNFGRLEVEEAGRTGRSVYELMLESLSPDPSPVLILPHFVGSGTPHMDPASKGAILGLDLSTTRDQLLKGILDSVTYEIKLSLDAMAEAGIRSRELRAIGGGARSARWLQTKADILGIPVVAMDVSEAPSLGAAILAGAATGAFPSVEQGIARMVHQRRTYEPDVTLGERYAERFALYQLVYPTLRDLNHAM